MPYENESPINISNYLKVLMQSYCVHASVHAFLLLLFRDLEEALSMGMDWSLREGTVCIFLINSFIFQYSVTSLIS